MLTKHIILASAMGAMVAFGSFSASADSLKGKVTKVDGGKITVGKKTVSVSNSRTAVLVKGKKAKRDAIMVGMSCTADVDGDAAKKIDCK